MAQTNMTHTSWQYHSIKTPSVEPNTLSESRVAIYKYENVYWVLDWRNVAGSFGEIQVSVEKKITAMHTFFVNSFYRNFYANTSNETYATEENFPNRKLSIDTLMEQSYLKILKKNLFLFQGWSDGNVILAKFVRWVFMENLICKMRKSVFWIHFHNVTKIEQDDDGWESAGTFEESLIRFAF